jgi:hypothetical protein
MERDGTRVNKDGKRRDREVSKDCKRRDRGE